MGRNGFSLIELLIVMAIAGTLLAIGTLYFRDMSVKSGIDRQTKELYADLMTTRAEALFQKKRRRVVISATSFSVYSSRVDSVSPLSTRNLNHAVNVDPADLKIDFDGSGIATFNGDRTVVDAAICAQTTDKGVVDSIAATKMQFLLGKQNSSGCSYGNITAQ